METSSAGADISIAVCIVGAEVLEACVGDPAFMAKDNWPGELAARVYKVMVAQSVREAAVASPSRRVPRSPLSPRLPESVRASSASNETLETAGS